MDRLCFRWEIGSFSAGFNSFSCSILQALGVEKVCDNGDLVKNVERSRAWLVLCSVVKGFPPFFQDMQDMRDCYDSLLSAAAATQNSAYGKHY